MRSWWECIATTPAVVMKTCSELMCWLSCTYTFIIFHLDTFILSILQYWTVLHFHQAVGSLAIQSMTYQLSHRNTLDILNLYEWEHRLSPTDYAESILHICSTLCDLAHMYSTFSESSLNSGSMEPFDTQYRQSCFSFKMVNVCWGTKGLFSCVFFLTDCSDSAKRVARVAWYALWVFQFFRWSQKKHHLRQFWKVRIACH